MIDNAINQLLRAFAGVADRVKPSTTVTRISDPMPRLVYSAIGGDRLYTDSGASTLIPGQYQLDVFAATATEARVVLDTIRLALDGYRGTVNGTRIDRISFPSVPRPGPLALDSAGANASVARLIQDMNVAYRD